MKYYLHLAFVVSLISSPVFSSVKKEGQKNKSNMANSLKQSDALLARYKMKLSKKQIKDLKKKTLSLSGAAVPTLVKVMKNDIYPEKNRWVATFLLGKIMGEKAAPFIAKFTQHPNWLMRLASLKTLLHLRQTKYKDIFVKALSDKSLIVRYQALDNIRIMNLKELAPHVWSMLYDKTNYAGKPGHFKRTHIVKQIIKTIGDLKFKKAKESMLTMIQKDKYKDIFDELDYSLNKVHPKNSPKGNISLKRHFWKRVAVSSKTI